MTVATLAKISPMNASTGVRSDIYVCSANTPEITGLNGTVWEPAITGPPALSMNRWNGDFQAPADPGSASLPINMEVVKETYPTADSLIWAGAPIIIYAEEIGTAWPWTERFIGKVKNFSRKGAVLTVVAEVDVEPFDLDVLSDTYAGTGGAEGGADIKNQLKPLILGWASNVEPVLIDAVNSVYQFSGYGPIEGVTKLYERGSEFMAADADFASYTLLVAAVIEPGHWATCLAEGMVRLGAPAYGVITGDVKGHAVSGTTPRNTANVISALAGIAGVDTADFYATALSSLGASTLGSKNINIVLTEQVKWRDIANRLVLACNWMPGISLLGEWFCASVAFGGSEVLTINAQGAALPQVTQSDELDVSVPYYKTIMGGNRCWRVHSLDEIAASYPIVDTGRYDAGRTYREGNIVDLADGSRWIYINADATAGNAPPTWPTTSNAYWDNITPPTTDLSSAYLTNESHTVATAEDGTGGDYSGAGGTFKVFYGGVDVTTSCAFTVLSATGGLTISGTPNVSINATTGVYAITGCTTDDGTATFEATYLGLTVTKVYSISKSKGGATAKTLMVIGDRQTIYYDSTGAASPSTQTTTFEAVKQNTTATVTWSVTDWAGVAQTPVTDFLSSATGNSVTMTEAQFADARNGTTGVIVTGTLTDGVTLSDKISVVRVTQGAAGLDAKVITVKSTFQTVTYDGTGAASPATQTNTFTCQKQNTSATCNWTLTDNLGNTLTPVTSYLSAASGDSVTMTEAQFAAALAVNASSGVQVTGTVVDGDTLTDTVSVVKVQAGSNALVAFLTNESVTLQASSTGTVSSFTTAVGNMKVFFGITDVTASCTFSEVSETGCTGDINTADNTPVAGQVKGYYRVTAMSADNATYVVRATYNGSSIDKTFTLAKAKQGTAGANGSNGTNGTNGTNGANGTRTAILYLYKWSSTTPTTWPSGTSTYTWATGAFTDPGTLNGWSRTIGTPSGGDKLWRIQQIFTDSDTSSTDTVTWSGSYTPEQYTPALGDLAALNTVATAKIDANAVTLLTAAFTSSSTTKTSGSWQSVQSITFTATGQPVLINAGILALGATDTLYLMRIKRGATVVWTATAYFTALSAFTYGTASVALVDTPSAGSVTYDLEINPSTDSVYAYDRFLSALETKR